MNFYKLIVEPDVKLTQAQRLDIENTLDNLTFEWCADEFTATVYSENGSIYCFAENGDGYFGFRV